MVASWTFKARRCVLFCEIYTFTSSEFRVTVLLWARYSANTKI